LRVLSPRHFPGSTSQRAIPFRPGVRQCEMGSICYAFLLLLSVGFAGAVDSESSLGMHEAALPAIGQVITMLANLVSMIDTEQETDDTDHTQYQQWSASETGITTQHVGQLQTSIQNTNAALADFRAQQQDLTTTLARVTGDLSGETAQLNSAIQRRGDEKLAFVTEQQNFDNAIAACQRAVEILQAHYGDGTTQELHRPDGALSVHASFLLQARKALLEVRDAAKKVQVGKAGSKVAALVQKALFEFRDAAKKVKVGKAGSKIAALVQEAPSANFETYQDSSSEAGNIVDEVRALAETFSEDKQAAIDQENQLQTAFATLRDQKVAMIGTLTAERDSQQSQLNLVNQNIAENEGALQVDTQLLGDKQAYLASLSAMLQAADGGYDDRKRYRSGEREAVLQAKSVLGQVSFMQSGEAIAGPTAKKIASHHLGEGKAFERIADHAGQGRSVKGLRGRRGVECKHCGKAVAMLREKASMLHSLVLSNAAAAATGLGDDGITDMIARLTSLVHNLDAEQQSEMEHKQWCETETGRTTQKLAGHETAVKSLQQTINSLGELISMKQTELDNNQRDIDTEDQAWKDLGKIRDAEKQAYDEDLQDTVDAIAAMNQAKGILADYYASQAALLQEDPLILANPRSGSQVTAMMVAISNEFSASENSLRSVETAALAAHETARQTHVQAMSDLSSNRNVLTVEKQTAEQATTSNQEDLSNNQGEIAAANTYLGRLSKSCQPLIDNYDERKRLRGEEKSAITEAVTILGEV